MKNPFLSSGEGINKLWPIYAVEALDKCKNILLNIVAWHKVKSMNSSIHHFLTDKAREIKLDSGILGAGRWWKRVLIKKYRKIFSDGTLYRCSSDSYIALYIYLLYSKKWILLCGCYPYMYLTEKESQKTKSSILLILNGHETGVVPKAVIMFLDADILHFCLQFSINLVFAF